MTRLLEEAYEVGADVPFVASDKNFHGGSLKVASVLATFIRNSAVRGRSRGLCRISKVRRGTRGHAEYPSRTKSRGACKCSTRDRAQALREVLFQARILHQC